MTASLGLYGYGVYQSRSLAFSYLIWNLFLAALPLFFARRLVVVLQRKRWSAWEPIGWTLMWLIFLPNSFYLITDFIHLRDVSPQHVLYAAVLFTSIIYLGVLLGFYSLYQVHRELHKRISNRAAAIWVATILLLCSFAIYIGRDLRWNSWDVVVNPAGLLFDISDRLLRPEAYPDMGVTVISFFALLGSLYMVVWAGARLLRQARPER